MPHLDVGDGVLDPGFDHVLQRIHAPVGGLERQVECEEGGLQVGQLHQQLDGADVGLPAGLYLLPALAQAWQRTQHAGRRAVSQWVGVRGCGG